MRSRRLVFLAFLVLAINPDLASSQTCYGASNVTANSTYSKNRNQALSGLLAPSANIVAKGGFWNATAGQKPDRVYAIAFCRPGAEVEPCLSCVSDTVRDTIKNCANNTAAYWWAGDVPCFVGYSSTSIIGRLELDPPFNVYNTGDLKTNMTLFDQTWDGLMRDLIRRASRGSSPQKYAVEKARLVSFMDIYAMVMCTPGLSHNDCELCLNEAARAYQRCCYGKQGGVSSKPSCFLRWDLYPFHGAFNNPVQYPPAPPPYVPPPSQPKSTGSTRKNKGGHSARTIMIAVSLVSLAVALTLLTYCLLHRRTKLKQDKGNQETDDEIENPDSKRFDLSTIWAATDNFDSSKMLGQGGFGAVYKGKLPNGQNIAVKRLGQNSRQGEREFKNEVFLLAGLEHRNLVKLLGFCLERGERLLVYEFIPNSSLDRYLFDPIKRLLLPWQTRYKIICGIARGLLYLHEDSRLRIIHRDLKAGNVLLDSNMDPKISDFGMAKLCQVDESQGHTRTPVGTFGYMAPEYIRGGRFSNKSDVYSFGVLLMEILSGERSTEFRKGEEGAESLTAYGWRLWREERVSNFFDPILRDSPMSELMRCLHIALLCVQGNISMRPTMYSVVLMLSSNTVSLAVPSTPGFVVQSDKSSSSQASDNQPRVQNSVNEASITDLEPRCHHVEKLVEENINDTTMKHNPYKLYAANDLEENINDTNSHGDATACGSTFSYMPTM